VGGRGGASRRGALLRALRMAVRGCKRLAVGAGRAVHHAAGCVQIVGRGVRGFL